MKTPFSFNINIIIIALTIEQYKATTLAKIPFNLQNYSVYYLLLPPLFLASNKCWRKNLPHDVSQCKNCNCNSKG